ncbi:MAG: nucleotidyl transferase AbiEii/AbiGii toxin family protein [Myxococcaceae bacterium]
MIQSGHFGPVRDTLLLEINFFVEPVPYTCMPIQSLIAEYFIRVGIFDPIMEYELKPFKLLVLDYRKTFIEKILSLAYAGLKDGSDSMVETRLRVRHFYDLTVLFRQADVKEFFESDKFEEWIQEVRQEEKLSTRLKWIHDRLSDAPLFKNTFQILDSVERFFKPDLDPLMFTSQDLPPFSEVRTCFKRISESVNLLGL